MQEKRTEPEERKANRLIQEKSPYLLQHAYNPVDWYPWGEEAFMKAETEDKPIFLSIGYSTCHWCHVMEKESFENEEVALLMNEVFVPVKVDREERPDIDSTYMSVCQALTGRGGWPLTIIMTPEKKPFLATTYIPRDSRLGTTGMLELVPMVKKMWAQKRDELVSNAEEIVSAISEASGKSGEDALDRNVLDKCFRQLRDNFDQVNGGFGNAPKFPTPHHLTFLLRYWKRTGDKDALAMVEKTLHAMRRGGIYDHIGFGFHRYSTDARWIVPHFEKMLYDQALIAIACTEAFQATHDKRYREVTREIFSYVTRDMLAPEGGFYSAEDADSEGEEGKFYVWTGAELESVLGDDEAELIKQLFSTSPEGNFRDEATGTSTGTNILYQKKDLREMAAESDRDPDQLSTEYERIREKLFNYREKRIHPAKDDKILTDWNGLMIVALCKASAAFGDKEYAELACRAADFILSEMKSPDGSLYHRYRGGEAAVEAFLEDYAFFIWGLTELYETTFETQYLKHALELNRHLTEHFRDEYNGGFFHTADYSEFLLFRNKEVYDGASPSGNSVCALNLLQLGRVTADADLENMAYEIFNTFAKQVMRVPLGYTQLLCALDFAVGPSREIVIVGETGNKGTEDLASCINQDFLPNKIIVFKPPERGSGIEEIAGYVSDMTMKDAKATAYICENYNCNLPANNREDIYKQLKTYN
ncbi:thioredoxin domain-containing protein [Methanolobus halotolerans]|uniref:Thioredoxin domain-containing protein n=1 Tax=Methanolobus halotolerans TaxID=2052935 RepID=A0A4E0R127_9EURY|nr:thioredoxin domain-containing protein [Methanolobus halotolerans]TGC10736.1 thioredoxin domain-containing protein [Methanolobus halotolerans]